MKASESHHFFIHSPEIAHLTLTPGSRLDLPSAIAHRVATILRLKEQESVTLFAGDRCVTIKLEMILGGKKSYASGTITHSETKAPLSPAITLVCGIVKTPTFEEICFTAAQLGVHRIIPVITEKSYTKPYTDKDFSRFNTICVAAAEQSKQIFLPAVEKPQKFTDILKTIPPSSAQKYLFEADGNSLRSVIEKETPSELIVAFGPEGGFSVSEQELLVKHDFEKLKLCTPILRTQDAIEVGIGALRSLLQ